MKAISQAAKRVMQKLVGGLERGQGRAIGEDADGNRTTVFMPVRVNRTGENLFTVAHTYVQNGDVMGDPMMEFLLGADREFYPVSFTQSSLGVMQVSARVKDGVVTHVAPSVQRDHAQFASGWMKNIRVQQGL